MKQSAQLRKALRGLKAGKELNRKLIHPLLAIGLLAVLLLAALTSLSTSCGSNTWSAMASGTSNDLHRVWGSSPSDVFAVGDYGTILHYDGSTWSVMTSGTTNSLYGVWGSSPSDVFAVGERGTILRYDGSTWSVVTSTTDWLYGVWGSSSSDVFVVGDLGTILHYNGNAWSEMTGAAEEPFDGVWGSSSSDVFAVGGSGTILHYDGSTWSVVTSTTSWLWGVWGSSSSDVFAVGALGTMLHYDGSAWSTMATGTKEYLSGVWGRSWSDVFAVGGFGTILHYDSSAWSSMASGAHQHLYDVWGSSSSDVFAVGDGGAILTQTVNAAPVNWGLIGGITGGAVFVVAALVYFLVIKRRVRGAGRGLKTKDEDPSSRSFTTPRRRIAAGIAAHHEPPGDSCRAIPSFAGPHAQHTVLGSERLSYRAGPKKQVEFDSAPGASQNSGTRTPRFPISVRHLPNGLLTLRSKSGILICNGQ